MKQFKLSRQPNPPGSVLTKFQVLDSASIIGSINVPNEEADDLARHWLGGATQPQAAAAVTPAGGNAMVNAMLKRSNAPAPAAARSKPRGPGSRDGGGR
jgi:hypothetical protein